MRMAINMNINISIAEEYDIPALAQLYQTTVLAIAPQQFERATKKLKLRQGVGCKVWGVGFFHDELYYQPEFYLGIFRAYHSVTT
jgi:hypothetical protein